MFEQFIEVIKQREGMLLIEIQLNEPDLTRRMHLSNAVKAQFKILLYEFGIFKLNVLHATGKEE